MKLALIGAGAWGKNFVKTINANPHLGQLSAIYSKNPETTELAPSSKVVSSSIEEFFKEKFEGVIIASPPETHFDLLKTALERGIPSIVEKPLTLKLEQAEELLSLWKSTGTPVLVDHIHLFNPAFQALVGAIGKARIMKIISTGGGPGPFRDYSALWDYAPHDLSMILTLLDEKPISHEFKVLCSEERTTEYALKLLFENATCDVHVGNNFAQKTRRLEVSTDRGEFIYDDFNSVKATLNQDPIHYVQTSPLRVLLELFVTESSAPVDRRWDLGLSVEVIRVLASC